MILQIGPAKTCKLFADFGDLCYFYVCLHYVLRIFIVYVSRLTSSRLFHSANWGAAMGIPNTAGIGRFWRRSTSSHGCRREACGCFCQCKKCKLHPVIEVRDTLKALNILNLKAKDIKNNKNPSFPSNQVLNFYSKTAGMFLGFQRTHFSRRFCGPRNPTQFQPSILSIKIHWCSCIPGFNRWKPKATRQNSKNTITSIQ